MAFTNPQVRSDSRPLGDSDEPSHGNPQGGDLAAACKAAKEKGSFSLHGGTLGNKWSRALKEDADLKAKYAQCKKGYEQQRKFRMAWMDTVWKDAQHTRTETHSISDSTTTTGEFHPLSVWLKKEGGDVAALRGLKTFLSKVVNRPDWMTFISVNEFTERVEVALPKKSWSNEFKNMYAITETAWSKPKGSKAAKRAITPNGEEKKKLKKVDAWKEITNIKTVSDKACRTAEMLGKNACASPKEWGWMIKMDEYAELRDRSNKIEQVFQQVQLFQQLQLMSPPQVKKLHQRQFQMF